MDEPGRVLLLLLLFTQRLFSKNVVRWGDWLSKTFWGLESVNSFVGKKKHQSLTWFVISSCWRGPHVEMQAQNQT